MTIKSTSAITTQLADQFNRVLSVILKNRVWVEIVLFIVVTYGLNYAILNWAQSDFLPSAIKQFVLKWAVLLQMWIPGTIVIIYRIIFQRGFKDIGWKIGKRMFW